MRPITCLAVLVLVAFSNAAIQKLGDVFHVDTRNPVHYPSSCLRTVDPDDADSVLYDPNAPASSRNKVLNQSWFWVSTVIGAVLAGIDSQSYESLFDTRKLMLSFFGIRQGRGPPAGTWEPTDMSQLPAQKLNFVRDRWRDAARAVSLTQQDDLKKPMLFCEFAFELQNKYSYVFDENGNKIKRPNSEVYYTLGEWEQEHGRKSEDFWYFWVDFEGHRGYLVENRQPGQIVPYPIDRRTNTPSPCQVENSSGQTWMVTTLPGDQSGGGTDAWLRETIIILCPSSFVDDDYTDEPQLQAQPIGTHLDDMGITAITLLHELFHAVQPGIGDHNPYLPKYTVDAHGNNIYHRDLPKSKSGFDRRRRLNPLETQSDGALQSMGFALYELAEPERMDLADMKSIRDPENLAWFGVTMLLQLFTGQDWSSGAARPAGSPQTHPTAIIPYLEPPAKIAPMTCPIYNGRAYGEVRPIKWAGADKNVTRPWKNMTGNGPHHNIRRLNDLHHVLQGEALSYHDAYDRHRVGQNAARL